jgi:[acyl-carrier-protein] S-malonyltransferase
MVSSATGELRTTASEVRAALIAQITRPVLWLQCVQTLRRRGCEIFLELGPGRTLSGLIRQTDRGIQTFSADSPDGLDRFAAAVGLDAAPVD